MQITRRSAIKATLGLAFCGMMPAFARASLLDFPPRSLHLYNTHTGESIKAVFWENGEYHADALASIAHVLRDHRNNAVHPFDPKLLDLLASLHNRVDSTQPFQVISGYRSPQSNALLHAHTTGVAVDSMHMYGRAIDIRLPDRPISAIRDAAWDMQQGGVGFYPASDFVHVDTGKVRRW